MNTLAISDARTLHSELYSQASSNAQVDVAAAMLAFEEELRHRLNEGVGLTLEGARGREKLLCSAPGFVDLLLALYAWTRARCSAARPGTKLKLRIRPLGSEIEIAIWDASPAPPSVRSLTLWSQVGARVEQLGARMLVEPAGQGQWRRVWIQRSCA